MGVIGFPKFKAPFFDGPQNKDDNIWGLYWGPPNLGKLRYRAHITLV